MSRLLKHRLVSSAAGRIGRSRTLVAFTMAEVLFAIMILGIGLILLAAAFPVGIVQGEKTQDMTNAGLIAQHAYDQMTKVPTAGVIPTASGAPGYTWAATSVSAYTTPAMSMQNYGDQAGGVPGKALAAALIDGTLATPPDLRVKLVYPATFYSDSSTSTTNPTWSDDCPMNQTVPGRAAYDNSAPNASPIPFVRLWGFRADVNGWQENVQWAYPADRRYYWYAFYRQMYTGIYPHPTVGMGPWTANSAALYNAVTWDHITRRTYRVTIVVCKAPKQFSIPYGTGTLTLSQIEPPSFFTRKYGPLDPNAIPAACMQQWAATLPNGGAALPPIRVPDKSNLDGANPGIQFDPADTTNSRTWITDSPVGGGMIAAGIRNSRIKRGGIVLDAWGNIYQILDVTDSSVHLDSPLPLLPATYGHSNICDALPLWFNPNAIAVFPTIVTKQADLP